MKLSFHHCFLGVFLAAQLSRAGLVYPPAPEDGPNVVRTNAARILQNDPKFLNGYRLDELTVDAPFRDYGFGPSNLLAGRLLSGASGGGWTYLLRHGDDVAGAEGLFVDPADQNALKFNGLYQSNFSREFAEAMRQAAQWPQVKAHDYEVRRLDSAPLHFVALWLHAQADDIIVPLPPTFGRLPPYQPCTEADVIRALKPDSRKVLAAPKEFR